MSKKSSVITGGVDDAEDHDLVGIFGVKDQALFKSVNKPHSNSGLISKSADAAYLWRFADVLERFFKSIKEFVATSTSSRAK